MKIIAGFLIVVLSSAPALAQQPVRATAEREAARIAAEQTGRRHAKSLLAGAVVASAGATVAILGATAFRTERTTSGNTPPTSFAQCEALKSNPVYAGNQCDALKGPNLAMVGSGIAVAALGATLMAIGSSRGSVQIRPNGVQFVVTSRR